MNNVNVTGRIMQLTVQDERALGTISIFRGYKKDDKSPIYDYLNFILFGSQVSRISKGSVVGLSGHLQSYQKDIGKEYPETVIQIFVEKVDTFQSPAKNNDEISINDSDMPGYLQGGNK